MCPTIVHVYGPIAIHSYGAFIVLGIFAFLFFVLRHPKREKLVSRDHFYTILSWGILAGLAGGHIVYAVTEMHSFSQYWHFLIIGEGFGLSILGTIIGIFIFLMYYLHHYEIALIPFLDLIAIYAPLAQSFGRIGCFFAGCCYGAPTHFPWSVTFTHPESIAPRFVALHPSQLYSAGILFSLFLLMHFLLQYRFKKSGQLISLYFAAVSIERFVIDFYRGDRTIAVLSLSYYQVISLFMLFSSILFFIYISKRSNKKEI